MAAHGSTIDQETGAYLDALPTPARAWLSALEPRSGVSPNRALRDAVGPLIRAYAREWGANLDGAPSDWPGYERRAASALAYHWWRYAEDRFRPLDEVVGLVVSGRLVYGRYNEDVLRDVVLAEAYLRRDPGAAGRFTAEFGGVITAEARRCGGRRAEQELQGFEAELLLPRPPRRAPHASPGPEPSRADAATHRTDLDSRPPRLALFAGHTPLRAWLRQVVRHEWATLMRRASRHEAWVESRADGDGADGASGGLMARRPEPGPDAAAWLHECLEMLHPLFARAAVAVNPGDAVLLRMITLDGVPQNRVALLEGVHKSTITRRVGKASLAIQKAFLTVAEEAGRGACFESCMRWLANEHSEGRLILAYHLAAAFRGLST